MAPAATGIALHLTMKFFNKKIISLANGHFYHIKSLMAFIREMIQRLLIGAYLK